MAKLYENHAEYVKDIRIFNAVLIDCIGTSLICRKNYAQFFAIVYLLVNGIFFRQWS